MADYYVNRNAQPNGDHEVHVKGCAQMPLPSNQLFLGDFSSCSSAVTEAKKHYTQVNGCAWCAEACHTS